LLGYFGDASTDAPKDAARNPDDVVTVMSLQTGFLARSASARIGLIRQNWQGTKREQREHSIIRDIPPRMNSIRGPAGYPGVVSFPESDGRSWLDLRVEVFAAHETDIVHVMHRTARRVFCFNITRSLGRILITASVGWMNS